MIKTQHAALPIRTAITLSVCLLATYSSAQEKQEEKANMESAMLEAWTGPFGGVPPWNLVHPEEFVASFDAAIDAAGREIDVIANNPAAPNFENTIVAMEKSGKQLERLANLFFVYSSNLNTGPIPDIEKAVMPKLTQYEDSITQNSRLFARIQSVYESDEFKDLDTAQKRLVEDRYKTFVRMGAKLSDGDKKTLSAINQRLTTLFTQFSQNVLHDEGDYITWIASEEELAGLPDTLVSAMKAAASEKGKPDQWAVLNTRSSMDPFLTYSENRKLREQVWRNYYARGDNGDDFDNKAIISEILQLRARRAKLLGYQTHAHWRLEPQMAKTPEAAMELMLKVWPKAVARVNEEVADMQKIADSEGADITIEPWDYRFYSEKVRKAKYDLDFNEVKPYLQLDKLRDAMMWASGELFGFQYQQLTDIPVFHPDVTVYEVTDAGGNHIGLWYFDPFAREGKRSGAWMTEYRQQENIDSPVTPIVSNNSNFVEGQEGEAVLVSWDDAVTLFHEFGHALHGLNSKCVYPSQAGTSVARDYVEFPSQVNEHWLSTPEVLNRFALHYQTNEPIPEELVKKIENASKFNQGFSTVEYLASALMDMKLHLAGEKPIDPAAFEKEELAALGMPSEVVMRHRMPHFLHIFADDGYSAGYYSYLWSDALTADAAEAFEEAGSYYDATLAQKLHDCIMSVGDTIDPAEGFRCFRGRDVDTAALLRKRGFPVD